MDTNKILEKIKKYQDIVRKNPRNVKAKFLIKKYKSLYKRSNTKPIDIPTTKEIKLEMLVEELRKTVCILGSIIKVQNANLYDDNVGKYLDDLLRDLSENYSLKGLKKYLHERY